MRPEAIIHRRQVVSRVNGPTLVLALMFLFNAINFLDRMLFAILQEPIKRDLALTDTQLGLLGGPAFAILYALAALPIARLADRGGRVRVIGGVLTLWSAMTAFCGAAGSFALLALGRGGVSIGEAGCAPAAHSLISAHFPSERRAGAISIFTSGTSVGTLAAAFGGAAVASAHGWRIAFFLCGALGLVLAATILLLLREPPLAVASGQAPRLGAVLRVLVAKRSFVHLCAGMSLGTMGGFAAIQYLTSFLIRAHGLTLVRAAGITGLMVGGVGFVATISTGIIVDRWRAKYPHVQMLLPAVAVVIGAIGYWIAFLAPSLPMVLIALVVGVAGMQSFLGPGFALAQDLASPRMRSTAAGLLMMIVGIVGYAIGSPLVGLISDAVVNHATAASGLSAHACAKMMTDPRCSAAEVSGLRSGLIIVVFAMAWAGLHFWLASRTMLRDAGSQSQASLAGGPAIE